MTGIIKTDQIQGAQSTTVTVPTGHTLAVTDNATVGGTLGVTGDVTATNTSGNRTLGIITGTSNSSILNMGDTDAANVGQVKYHHGVNSMVLRTNGSDKVTLDATGNLLFNAASTGVYLGVTSATAANLLDDYEEGSWTPSVGGNTTYNNQRGRYVKIGSQVNLWFYIQINQRNSPGTPFIVGGSPFTNSGQVAGSGLVHYFQSIQNSAVVLTCRIDTSGANINVSGATGSSTTIANVNHDWVGNGSEVYGFVTHYVGS